MLDRVSTTSR